MQIHALTWILCSLCAPWASIHFLWKHALGSPPPAPKSSYTIGIKLSDLRPPRCMAGLFWWLPLCIWGCATPHSRYGAFSKVKCADAGLLRMGYSSPCSGVWQHTGAPVRAPPHPDAWMHGFLCSSRLPIDGSPAPFFHLVNTRHYHSNGRSYSCSQPWQNRSDSKVQWLFLRPSAWSLTNSPWVLLL